jgi:uncharacterized protein with von Willebrand factor type A (vWA) domain
MIRHANIDRYVFEQLMNADADARERIRTAKRHAPWFTEALFADVFYCFYLPRPQPVSEGDRTESAFHRWLIRTFMSQYLYVTMHRRTVGAPAASFRTALKAIMWLTEQFAAEASRRQQEQRRLPALAEQAELSAGPAEVAKGDAKEDAGTSGGAGARGGGGAKGGGGSQANDEGRLGERLPAVQREQLKHTGYRLEAGKHAAEQRQVALDKRPLLEQEVAELKANIAALRESMRTDVVRRDKWRRKLEQAEQELAARHKALERLDAAQNKAFAALDEELGEWLNGALSVTLAEEERDTRQWDALVQASLRLANRRWGHDLGKLRRQAYKDYLRWVEQLRAHPELIAMIEAVGRHTETVLRQRRPSRPHMLPDRYDELGLSSDLAHLLPSEASLLADPDVEAWFWVKWLEGKLMTYRAYGPDTAFGRGQVICLLDTSHSMRGGKLRLAQIFVMTFAALTLHEQRDFMLLLFGAKGEKVEVSLRHRKPDWPAFYRLAQLAFVGGTNFDTPLRRGMALVRSSPMYKHADIIMVTDGIGAVTSAVRAELQALGHEVQLRLHTLIIGATRQHKQEAYDLEGISHTVRYAATWDAGEPSANGLLLDVLS